MLTRREGSIAENFLPCLTDHNTKKIIATQSVHIPCIETAHYSRYNFYSDFSNSKKISINNILIIIKLKETKC